MTTKTTVKLAASLLSLPLALVASVACTDDAEGEPMFTEDEAPEQFRTWTPTPIDPNLCDDPEFEPSLPPVTGKCDIEVRLVQTSFVTGQGISEGRGELSTEVTATANTSSTTANVPESIYNVGETKGHNLSLGTYTVKAGKTRNITVCAEFTEHDGNGLNGSDDVGSDCIPVQLQCHPVHGQPSFEATIGPEPLCGPNQCNGSASATIEVMRADADMDGVPNEDDFTPEPCDEADKATEGLALLLYYHYDDDAFVSLAQSVGTNLSKHFDEYDYVVLLMDQATSNAGNTSAAAFKNADVVYPPTRDGMLEAMRHLTAEGYRFDVKTHAHGYTNGADDSKFEVLSGDEISGNWLVGATDPNAIGTALGGVPIVALWGTTCYQGRQIDAWNTIGAKAGSGANDINFFPNAWLNYWDAWVSGTQYKTSVDDSVTVGVVAATDTFIAAEGAVGPYWCITPTVLGTNACAEDFFNDDVLPNDARYNLEDIYDHTLSGAENMQLASERLFVGNQALTFGGGGSVWP